MKSKQKSPVWPYLGILACLFVLSITAPRAWDRMARQESLTGIVSAHQPRRETAPVEIFYERSEASELAAREAIIEPVPVALPTTEEPAPAPPAEPLAGQVVPPVPEFAQEFAEPDLEVADRSSAPEMALPETEAPEEPVDEPAVASSAWPLPRVLLGQLTQLVEEDPSAVWAEQAISLIHDLCRPTTEGEHPLSDIIVQLRRLAEQNSSAAADPRLEAQQARTRYALTRWLAIWQPTLALGRLPVGGTTLTSANDKIEACLANVDALTRKGPSGNAWREYLQLDALKRLANDSDSSTVEARRAAARKVLDRLTAHRLSSSQRKFADEKPLVALQAELRAWAAEPVTSARLLAHLEEYERTGLASDAHLVADDFRGLVWASGDEAQQLSEQLDTHYRNANVRIAVANALANRFVPQPKEIEAPVNDVVVNVPVHGRSTTFTKLFVRFVPDPRRIRVGLEANGLVASDTVSTSGPATFYNNGQSTFLVRKLMVLGPQGLSVWPAVAEAENNCSYLVSLETDFDGVPLVGSLVRNIARSQHDDARDEAKMEVEQKVATRARDQLDAEIRPRLVKAAESVQKKQLATLNRLGLELVPLGLQTTEDRIMARLRVASTEQLGAHTPRPRAPSDCWFSLQLHQSALNNGLEQLHLDGRTFTLPELFVWIAEKLDRPQMAQQDDLPEDVQLTFAKQDAVRLRAEDGRIELTLAFAELHQGGKTWRDFTVRTFYRPEPDGLAARFARDSTISLDGKNFKGKVQVVLRTIFSKVLSRERELSLMDERFTSDSRLQDLEISQFVVEDGWIGLAYGPRRVASDTARQSKQSAAVYSPR